MAQATKRRRVSDIVPTQARMEGEQYNVRDMVGQEFVITEISEREGSTGNYLGVQFEVDGKPGFFFTSHQAIYSKLLKCLDDLPLLATVTEQEGASSGRQYFDIE